MEFLGDLERAFATNLYPLRVPIGLALVGSVVALVFIARRGGWLAAARRRPTRSALMLAILLVVLLPSAWYLGSPVFIRTSLIEPAPTVLPAVAATIVPPTAAPTTGAPPTLRATRSGEFAGADEFHFGRGTASLSETSPGRWAVRFEEFSVRNGPDLHVYLSPDADGYGDGVLELGALKATDGAFNYDVPAGARVTEFRSVVIWCKQFGVLFAVAPLS